MVIFVVFLCYNIYIIKIKEKPVMIIFSEIICRANDTPYVAIGLVGGTPVCYADLIDWNIFKNFLLECNADSRITVEVRTLGYGEGEKLDATPEEVAYMNMRCGMNDRFLEERCELVRRNKIDIDLRYYGKRPFSFVEPN
jgi:hypothetical protein